MLDPSKIDLGSIHEAKLAEIATYIKENLTEKQISDIDFRLLGSLVLNKSKTLSVRVNEELLEPISRWLNDPEWMKKYRIYENNNYNWASYKRTQRRWTKKQKYLMAERLKRYRMEVRKRQKISKELRQIIGKPSSGKRVKIRLKQNFIMPIASPFSPEAQQRQETRREFCQALNLTVSDLLPWKLLLKSELNEINLIKLKELKTYYTEDKKRDTVSKLMHLLDLEKQGQVTIDQERAFGDITIQLSQDQAEETITITDQEGKDYHFDWLVLSTHQREKVIHDIKGHQVLCKTP